MNEHEQIGIYLGDLTANGRGYRLIVAPKSKEVLLTYEEAVRRFVNAGGVWIMPCRDEMLFIHEKMNSLPLKDVLSIDKYWIQSGEGLPGKALAVQGNKVNWADKSQKLLVRPVGRIWRMYEDS
jgi:hypothetical protein